MTRSEATLVLSRIVVAPITRTVRDISTEVLQGSDEGLPVTCVANFDILQPVRKAFLTELIGRIDPRRAAICGALDALADC